MHYIHERNKQRKYALGNYINLFLYTYARQNYFLHSFIRSTFPLQRAELQKELIDMNSSLHLQENCDRKVTLFLRKIKQCHVSNIPRTRLVHVMLSLLTSLTATLLLICISVFIVHSSVHNITSRFMLYLHYVWIVGPYDIHVLHSAVKLIDLTSQFDSPFCHQIELIQLTMQH